MIHIPQLRKQAQPGPATGTKTQLLAGGSGCRAGLFCSSTLALSVHASAAFDPAALAVVCMVAADLLSGPGGGEGRSSLSVPTP